MNITEWESNFIAFKRMELRDIISVNRVYMDNKLQFIELRDQ
jgi:hypothetical protein